MLEKEKKEINELLKKAAEELANKIREKERPIVVENDLVQHLTNRIDQYLFKRWPELFVDENFKEWKKELEKISEELKNKDMRINALLKETEGRCKTMMKENEHRITELSNRLKEVEGRPSFLDRIFKRQKDD